MIEGDSPEQIVSELRQKISLLSTFEGDSLRGEMNALKKAITENPAACSLLHDEDIGTMVRALRKIVGVAVATAAAPKEKKPAAASKKMSPEEFKAAIDKIDLNDL